MRCSACGAENEPGRKFCGECGAKLAAACASCGTPNPAGTKFCGECGAPLGDVAAAAATVATPDVPSGREAPEAERRLVSVLFADLVGFTTLSESRDAEDVRDLLTRYFDTCRQLIERYGGTVEKFIGDAVMAVWGTPVAKEEDAERAVRTALDLTDAVAALGQEAGAPDLRARAGVLTGEAVVTLGATGQGMVAGDMVNTASRIQSAASPGQVFVGEATKRSTEAAIVYDDAGTHELKGKAEPMPLWRAVRVIGGLGGAQRSIGLEAPFVGRDRDLRVIKEMFHASAEEHRAHLVSVVGIAGTGKSRLMWEFNKYIDGLAGNVRWHRGRCLPYGEGVTYWALAEMVRTRASILEGESPDTALEKLHTAVVETIADPEERAWVEPRLAHLLGLEEGSSWDRESLFSAWRLFYERLSEEMPTVMVFEDMQWADTSLLDFVEYLLEWSKNHALFVLALARPDLIDQRPTWGSGSRNSTMLSLEPLPEGAMEALLTGLVPGLPDELRSQIFARAEGVPLYAVETVRMLMDRGLLVQEGSSYRPSGPIDLQEIPETLHALIAARLDGLSSDERLLIQDGAVLGKTFTVAGLAALSGLSEAEIEPLLSSLVRKEVLSLQADPVSPERGQYGFLQELVRRVAYETLSKKDRREKHVAAAQYIEGIRGQDEEEFVEIVATHYLEAWKAAPDAPDAAEVKGRARGSLVLAGERAASLAAHVEAQRYFEEAAELADDIGVRASLVERAGIAAQAAGATTLAVERFEHAIELFEQEGQTHPAARVSARLGQAQWDIGRFADGVDRMEASLKVLSGEEPDEDLALLSHEMGRMDFFSGRIDLAEERIEFAIDIAEGLWLPELLSNALNTKAVILGSARARRREAYGLMQYALELALENDLPEATMRAYYNLSDLACQSDKYRESKDFVEKGLALARRLGNRDWEWRFLGQVQSFILLGEWDLALSSVDEIPAEAVPEARLATSALLLLEPLIQVARGETAEAAEAFARYPAVDESADIQELMMHRAGRSMLQLADGDPAGAMASAREVLAVWEAVGIASEPGTFGFLACVEAAFALHDLEAVEELLSMVEAIPPGKRPQFLQAHVMHFGARLAAQKGTDGAEQGFKGAAGLFRELETPFYMAAVLVEHGEWLAEQGRVDEAGSLLSEAHEVFERLKARPWLERVEKLQPSEASIA